VDIPTSSLTSMHFVEACYRSHSMALCRQNLEGFQNFRDFFGQITPRALSQWD
jgi:hypothetical protein